MPAAAKRTNGAVASTSSAADRRPVTVPDFLSARSRGVRLTMLTAYDYTMARLLDAAGVDGILVGDSLGMVVQGNEHSLSVTLDEMIYHTRCVSRGVRRSLLVADMPFMSYQVSPQQALENAGRLVKEGGAHAVKLEGGVRSEASIAAIAAADIPVMGHIGLTPQSVRRLGGFRVQRDEAKLLDDARATEQAGAFALVIECVPSELARKITESVSIPTIGIGAGPACDGQILVTPDLLGLYEDVRPRFVKQYAELGREVLRAVEAFCREVQERKFPAAEHQFR
ncbi:MAG: 3-methyl-2-oxobutanoate hydroxymethyltransferase [Gemmataceae bacterium]|nr:3-methyl-2-oxobutanoate hydroxymethyltransferase [Gemmataceae bacterium]MDW8263744.1 3-methyl-2-oxobutanoate hydroxymethyltransferase [Gemmataceae bacterium]